ncbi:MAG: E3 binding domain-containing protein [Planctomycetes bacterium]|nr:E3 binding domain-containing protein [Planctomycetota bacterium]
MYLIRIPKFSENMEEATIVEWLRKEGDVVTPGDVLLSVITDKADFEIEAEANGVLLRIVAAEKSSVPVNYVVGLIGTPGEALPDYERMNCEAREQFAALATGSPAPSSGTAGQKRPEGAGVPASGEVGEGGGRGIGPAASPPASGQPAAPMAVRAASPSPASGVRVMATPAARRVAKEQGVDLAAVQAWAKAAGPVTQEMVEAFVRQRP